MIKVIKVADEGLSLKHLGVFALLLTAGVSLSLQGPSFPFNYMSFIKGIIVKFANLK